MIHPLLGPYMQIFIPALGGHASRRPRAALEKEHGVHEGEPLHATHVPSGPLQRGSILACAPAHVLQQHLRARQHTASLRNLRTAAVASHRASTVLSHLLPCMAQAVCHELMAERQRGCMLQWRASGTAA